MTTFALIGEGITGQVVIDALICTVCENAPDGVAMQFLQPLRDSTDLSRQGNFGGWELVLEYSADSNRIREALSTNDFLVIHIDTDLAEHPRFGVPRQDGGKAKAVKTLVEQTRERIIREIGADVFDLYAGQFLFAISVHTIECCLLAVYGKDAAKRQKVDNCQSHINKELDRLDIVYRKDPRCYSDLSREFAKKKAVVKAMEHSESLSMFVDSLPRFEAAAIADG